VVRAPDHAKARRKCTRLAAPELADLITGYRQGATVKELGHRFGIHRVTVTSLLRKQGVKLRRTGLTLDELVAASGLYSDGWSLAKLGTKFEVDATTAWRALVAAGVEMRPPHTSLKPTRSEARGL
jgi:hypothetical protein